MSHIKVIAGSARGRYIKSFENDLSVRPILARIKKSLFDIIRNKLIDASFLDLYAGTGAVGIEALSRGANNVVFVDADKRCVELIKENLKILKLDSKARVYQANVPGDLGSIKEKFDIIFLGPPYKDKNKIPLSLSSPTIAMIENSGLLKSNTLVIAQHHMKEIVVTGGNLEVFREEEYGDTVVTFLKIKTEQVNAK